MALIGPAAGEALTAHRDLEAALARPGVEATRTFVTGLLPSQTSRAAIVAIVVSTA